jgi:F-type H+/Na+-transporting ATPase subunit alpha
MTFDHLHDDLFAPLEDALARVRPAVETAEIAHVLSVGSGVAEVLASPTCAPTSC